MGVSLIHIHIHTPCIATGLSPLPGSRICVGIAMLGFFSFASGRVGARALRDCGMLIITWVCNCFLRRYFSNFSAGTSAGGTTTACVGLACLVAGVLIGVQHRFIDADNLNRISQDTSALVTNRAATTSSPAAGAYNNSSNSSSCQISYSSRAAGNSGWHFQLHRSQSSRLNHQRQQAVSSSSKCQSNSQQKGRPRPQPLQ